MDRGVKGSQARAYSTSFAVFWALGALGIVMQAVAGSFEVGLAAFPVNVALGGLIILAAAWLSIGRETAVFRLLSGVPFSVTAIGALAVCCLVMGLVPQYDGGGLLGDVTSSWSFVMIYLALLLSLGCVTGRALANFDGRRWGFYLNHAGLWLVLAGAGLGSGDRLEVTVKIPEGATATHGITAAMMPVRLPFAVTLRDFRMEQYPDGSPRSFTSEVAVALPDGSQRHADIEVNHPLSLRSWALYQLSYDRQAGAGSSYSVLKGVRDPWLPVVYAGIVMLAAGAFSMFVRKR